MPTQEELYGLMLDSNIPAVYTNKWLDETPKFSPMREFVLQRKFKGKPGIIFLDQRPEGLKEITDLFYLTARGIAIPGDFSIYVTTLLDLSNPDYFFKQSDFLRGVDCLFVDGFFDSDFPVFTTEPGVLKRISFLFQERATNGLFTAYKVLGCVDQIKEFWGKRLGILLSSFPCVEVSSERVSIT